PPAPSGLSGGAVRRGYSRGAGAVRRQLLRPYVRHHGRVSSLLRPSRVQNEPDLSVLSGLARMQRHAEGPPLVGLPPPPTPSLSRHAGGPALAARHHLLVVARRLDPLRRPPRHHRAGDSGLESLPRAALARPLPLAPRPVACRALLAPRRLERARVGLRLQHGALLPHHLLDQLAEPPVGPQALRD